MVACRTQWSMSSLENHDLKDHKVGLTKERSRRNITVMDIESGRLPRRLEGLAIPSEAAGCLVTNYISALDLCLAE